MSENKRRTSFSERSTASKVVMLLVIIAAIVLFFLAWTPLYNLGKEFGSSLAFLAETR